MSRRSLTARIGFTLGALLSYRLGTYIPVPNVDPAVIGELYERSFQGISQVYAARRISFEGLSIFALGVFPYLLANAMVLLAAAFSPKLRASVFRGQHGYRGSSPMSAI